MATSGRRGVLKLAAVSAASLVPGACAVTNPAAWRDWARAPRHSADWVRGSDIVLTRSTASGITSAVAWRDDSRRLAIRTGSGHGFLIEPQTDRTLARLPAPQSSGTSHGVTFVPGTRLLALGGPLLGQSRPSPVALTLVDDDTAELRQQIEGLMPLHGPPGLAARRHGVGYSPIANAPQRILRGGLTGNLLVVPYDGVVGLESFDPTTWQASLVPLDAVCHRTTAISPDGQWVASTFGSARPILIERRSGRVVGRFGDGTGDVGEMAFSPDNRLLVATMSGWLPRSAPKLRLIDCASATERLAGADLPACLSVGFHPDGGLMAVGTDDGIVFCDPQSGTVLRRQRLPYQYPEHVSFSPDGTMLAAGTPGRVYVLGAQAGA